jgi:signal transduction histidine kinase
MNIIFMRDTILIVGWPVLIFGSFFIFYQAHRYKKEIEKHNPFGSLVLVLTIGIIITMFSLAIAATFAMIAAPASTVPVIVPLFIVWLILMLIVISKVKNLDTKVRRYNAGIQELQQAKTEFITIASHQLRTPLAGINWILQRIQESPELPSVLLPDIKKMYLTNQEMILLVSNILNNTRIETGQLSVHKENHNLKDLITEVIDLLSTNALAKDQVIVFDAHNQENTETCVDRMLFSESLKNFLSNAITHGDPKTQITVSLIAEPDMFTVSVHNLGKPIPLEQRKKLFTKFSRHVQSENQSVPDVEVGGVGLFIAKVFIDLSGGSVWYDSAEEKGTTFYFSLPRLISGSF